MNLSELSISDLARIITNDWRTKDDPFRSPAVNFAARPYLSAMLQLDSINDSFIMDSGRDIVSRFLANASTWRGSVAREVKAELRKRLKQK